MWDEKNVEIGRRVKQEDGRGETEELREWSIMTFKEMNMGREAVDL